MITRTLSLSLALVGLVLLSACASPRTRPVDTRVARDPNAPVPKQVFIDAYVVRVPEAQVASVLGELRPVVGRQIHDLDAERAEALLAAVDENDAVRTIQAPKMLALHDQDSSIWVGETIRYGISKAEEDENGGLTFSIDDAGSIDIGERMEITPRIVGRRIEMKLHRVSREFKSSYEALDLSDAARLHANGELEAKHVRTSEVEAAFQINDGGWILLGNPEWVEDEAGRSLHVIVLGARILDDERAMGIQLTDEFMQPLSDG